MTHTEGADRRHPHGVPALPPDDCDEDDLDAYAKEIVDALPPLTSEQRDLLALIFRQHRK
jgi:hypothetical protein